MGTLVLHRRHVLRSAAASGAVVLAALSGCSELSLPDENSLEIQHYWVEDDGGTAMERLLAAFAERYPEIEIVENPIAGGADENLQDVVSRRVRGGNPPSTWQTWAGPTLRPFVDEGVLRDLDDGIFDAETRESYRDIALDAATIDGAIVTVPINIHRINNCYYKPAILDEAGIDPDDLDSIDALLEAFETVETETDATATVRQTSSGWSTAQHWELALLSAADVETFERLTAGDVDPDAVRRALDWVADVRSFLPADADSLTWTRANRRFVDDDVAFYVQGDWASAVYEHAVDGFDYGAEWDAMPFPGTEGSYLLNLDSFPFPTANPTPDVTEAFLAFCTEPETQAMFNRFKGSIPPRIDAPIDDFGPYRCDQIDAFDTASARPPAIANGLALDPAVKDEFDDAFATFVDDWDVPAAADAIVDALADE